MSSYLSSILTNTTSRYNSIRRTLLSDENDGDTEDDSHVSRVLRAYYTEKGRPFPPWLPPDPNAAQPATAPYMYSSRNDGVQGGGGARPAQGPPRGSGLSDLWDTPNTGGDPHQQQEAPLSLRRGVQPRVAQATSRSVHPSRPNPYETDRQQAPQGRPLPSQRAGSYQSSSYSQRGAGSESMPHSPSPPSTASSATSMATTAQERLKAKLLGGRASPALPTSSSSQSPLQSPALSQRGNPYERGNSYGDRGVGRYNSGGGNNGGGGGADPRREQKPYVGSSAPWSTGEDEYAPRGGRLEGAGGGGGANYSRGGGGGGGGGGVGRSYDGSADGASGYSRRGGQRGEGNRYGQGGGSSMF
ncbi:MAG: hypothetical protein M1825_003532 [Sarcosagium campestre]|nr:MAG: hypothetical protein M1825_003532 [Sarcosagium campestre]